MRTWAPGVVPRDAPLLALLAPPPPPHVCAAPLGDMMHSSGGAAAGAGPELWPVWRRRAVAAAPVARTGRRMTGLRALLSALADAVAPWAAAAGARDDGDRDDGDRDGDGGGGGGGGDDGLSLRALCTLREFAAEPGDRAADPGEKRLLATRAGLDIAVVEPWLSCAWRRRALASVGGALASMPRSRRRVGAAVGEHTAGPGVAAAGGGGGGKRAGGRTRRHSRGGSSGDASAAGDGGDGARRPRLEPLRSSVADVGASAAITPVG